MEERHPGVRLIGGGLVMMRGMGREGRVDKLGGVRIKGNGLVFRGGESIGNTFASGFVS